jgi:hydrogenase-4 component E
VPLVAGVAAPPSSYAGLTTTLAVLMLVIEFGMLQATLLRAQVRLYAAQSVVISVLAVVVAFSRGVPELYGLAAFSVLLKVVAVPLVMLRLLRRTNQEIAGSRALGVASMVLLAVGSPLSGFSPVPGSGWAARCCRAPPSRWPWPSF